MKIPAIKPHFCVETIQGEGVLLLSEEGHTLLSGRLYELCVPLIDGRRTEEEIVDSLEDRMSPAEVYYTLNLLEQEGYIVEGQDLAPGGMTAFWTATGILPQTAADRLARTDVQVTAFGDLDPVPLHAILEELGIRTSPLGVLGVVITDDYLRRDNELYNQRAVTEETPWMLFKPVGLELFFGPIFIPGQTGCWNCLKTRYASNRGIEQFVTEKLERNEPVPVFTAFTAATLHTAFSMAAQMIAEWIVHPDDHALKGKIISLDVRSWKITQHALPMLPHCPVCGDQKELCANGAQEPIRLRSDTIMFQEDGGYRIRRPEDTIAEFAHLVSPITGIVSVLEKEEGTDSLAPLYRAGHNLAVRYDSLSSLKRGISGGKGMTDLQAKASGLCEAIERYCGVYQGCEQRITSSLTRLGSDAVHPCSCMLFSEDQYRNRETINAGQSRFNHVPEPFDDPDKQIEWSSVWSLTHENFRYLPTQFLYYQYRYADDGMLPVYFSACSNGAASGNSLEEAVLQGFLELVERDGVALWWYNMLPRPVVDLASFQVSYFLELKAFYRSIHRELWVIDITSDLNIPTFAALSRRIDIPEEQILFGFGAHLNARLAIQRALTEMNQSLPLVTFAMRGDGSADAGFGDTEAIRWWQTATVENQPYLVADRSLPPRCAEDFSRDVGDDLLEKIEYCRGAIEAQGLEMLVLDQTRPDIGLPVVKVIVPGLRHFWPRFAPGRLYDVPVKMGWLVKPRKEMDLNPVAMFV